MPSSRTGWTTRGTAFAALLSTAGFAAAADWQLVGYLLPDNGHPCVNDPYVEAGYVWIRKDEGAAAHRDQLRAAVKAQNPRATMAGPWPVREDRPVFLVAKQWNCKVDGKTYSPINYEFIAAADEAALEETMKSKMKLYREIVSYTVEKISRPVRELDQAGTPTVVGRTR